MSFTLYDLTGRYLELLELVDATEDGEERFRDTLEMLEDDIQDKVDNIGKLIKSIESEVDALENEKKRLEQRIHARRNKVKHLKEYLQDSLEGLDMQRIKTPLFTAWLQNNPHTVEVVDEESIPDDYFIEQPKKLDKNLIIQALKEGREIDGVKLTQTKGIRIR